jgi:4-aminobutyrate aminotransferase-like enzyme
MQNKSMIANPVNVIVLAPPLIISTDEIEEGVAIMDIALEAADAHTE